ncbi:hypothetical protein GXP75_20970 [Bacillus sp. HU-1818]|uniref:hypothetical protein n=1 Tax=Bacillus sp. HU-1818 TaxID=2704469 RepID=UPI001F5C7777|nr:hypothetical protein [Bacillus sp. HU-1818]MCI3198081.1 hypothetical protein [Bacillus sp. HU-1818]
MSLEEYQKQFELNQLEANAFKRGVKEGMKRAEHIKKRNENMQTLLLECIGYDDEWLTTRSGYKRQKRDVLVDIIFEQRSLMKSIFNKLEPEAQEDLKKEIEKYFWPAMHNED